jgi:uncharacterized protein (UPF0179 family)
MGISTVGRVLANGGMRFDRNIGPIYRPKHCQDAQRCLSFREGS